METSKCFAMREKKVMETLLIGRDEPLPRGIKLKVPGGRAALQNMKNTT